MLVTLFGIVTLLKLLHPANTKEVTLGIYFNTVSPLVVIIELIVFVLYELKSNSPYKLNRCILYIGKAPGIDYCPEYSLRENIGPGLILAGSLSKILGVPGIRIGYLCAVPETVQRLQLRMLPWSVDALATEIAVHLPDHKDEIIRDAERNAVRRERFSSQLRQLGAEVYPSRGNFLLADFCRDMSSAAVRLRSRGILVRTCSSFGLPGSFWRLAVRTEDENTRLITELEEILHER